MRKIYQTSINKLSKHEHYNIEICWEHTSIPQISHPKRWLVLLWVSWKEPNSCSTGTLLKTLYGNGRKDFLEYSHKEFMQGDHICTSFYSILFITSHYICPWFLIVFQIWQYWSNNSKLLYFMQIKALKTWRCKSSVISGVRWNSTLLFLRIHAVASFRNIWLACSTRISACLQALKRRLWLP